MSETGKTDPRLQAYADVDETNAHLGVVLATGEVEDDVAAVLTHVQNDLFDVGADFCTPVVREPGVPAAAHRAGLRRPPRGLVRPLQRGPAEAALVHPQRRHRRRRPPARRPHRLPPRGALGLGGARGVRRLDERPRDHLPQPALRPAVHPGPPREPRERRRALGPRRRARRAAPTGDGTPDDCQLTASIAPPTDVSRLPGNPRRDRGPRPRRPRLEPGLQAGERAGAHGELGLAARGAADHDDVAGVERVLLGALGLALGERGEVVAAPGRARGPGSGEKMRNHSSESSR